MNVSLCTFVFSFRGHPIRLYSASPKIIDTVLYFDGCHHFGTKSSGSPGPSQTAAASCSVIRETAKLTFARDRWSSAFQLSIVLGTEGGTGFKVHMSIYPFRSSEAVRGMQRMDLW